MNDAKSLKSAEWKSSIIRFKNFAGHSRGRRIVALIESGNE